MSALRADRDTTEEDAAPEVSDDGELRGLGVCRCNVGASVDLSGWADEYAKVTPLSGFAEDGEYAQYRNIMDDEAFPFAAVKAALTSCVEANFVSSMGKELRLDDAFAIHYNESHWDTTVKKHTDPSDVTVNLCLERSPDLRGSQVLFFGHQRLRGSTAHDSVVGGSNGSGSNNNSTSTSTSTSRTSTSTSTSSTSDAPEMPACVSPACDPSPAPLALGVPGAAATTGPCAAPAVPPQGPPQGLPHGPPQGQAPRTFRVQPESGWATVHWGRHPHLVTALRRGQRTNIILTFCFVDPAKSTANKSDCFLDPGLR